MPLINVKLIEGVFDESQKRQMVERLTDTGASVAIRRRPRTSRLSSAVGRRLHGDPAGRRPGGPQR